MKKIIDLSIVLLVSILLSYLVVSNKDVKSNELEFKYIDETLSDLNISDGWSSVKSFSVKNNSSSTKKYNLVIKNFINTFKGSGLEYKVTSTNNGYNMSSFKSLAKSESLNDEVISYNTSIDSGVTQTYTVTFRYTNGVEDDIGGKLSGMFSISEGTSQSLYSKLLEDKTDKKTRTDFSTALTADNTNTLYTSTENGTTVYYFAGNPTDNWVKFGKYNKDYIIYRGYQSSTSSKYLEYTTLEECSSAKDYNYNCSEFKLASSGDDIYWRIIRTNEDGGIRLLYHGASHDSTTSFITRSSFNDDSSYQKSAGYMYDSNNTSSEIKTVIDNWYKDNIYTNYGKYLSETAVYCNDRTSTSSENKTTYGSGIRLWTNKIPSYDCENNEDKFTVSTNTGNGKLTYPVALITADELSFAGGSSSGSSTTYYYYNSAKGSSTGSTEWWTMSPAWWEPNMMYFFHVVNYINPGQFASGIPSGEKLVRPVTSLKSCVKWASGDGSATNPYTIIESESGC